MASLQLCLTENLLSGIVSVATAISFTVNLSMETFELPGDSRSLASSAKEYH